jgi:allantoinase
MSELVVRGGTIISPAGRSRADVACEDGRIVAIGPELPGAPEEVDARGLLVLPGVIDVHLHFNEPGRTDWEGGATGSRALAAGGGTLFFDMPLNSTPCTITAVEFDRKRAALEASSITDFGLWGGLVPGAVPHMAEMAARGVVGFKAFMCDSGLPEFPRADEQTLDEGMREAARLGTIVAVHAESEEMTRRLTAAATGRDAAAFLASRPLAAEIEAIGQALRCAARTRARVHIVHVSSGAGVAMAAQARADGVDVSIETCPHYLTFTAADLERLGTVAKCAPPFRSAAEHDTLWNELLAGHVDIVASDHSPTEPSRKQGEFMAAWGGVAGVQSTLAVLLDVALSAGSLTVERITELLAGAPSRRFGVPSKGALEVGRDADLVLIDPAESFTLAEMDLQQRHPASPYVGRRFRGRVRRTIRRGETIFMNGRVTARTKGRFVASVRPRVQGT